MYHTTPQGTSKMVIESFMMGESARYQTQWSRPYVVDDRYCVLSDISERLRESGAVRGDIQPTVLGQAASSFLRPSGQTEREILIPNGWGERRFYFMMTVTFITPIDRQSFLVLGYTDQADRSLQSKQIDPNTTFYINSVTQLTTIYHSNGTRGVQTGSSFHVHADHQYNNYRNTFENNNKLYAMRPSDLYHHLQLNQQGNEYVDPMTSMVTRNVITGSPKTAQRTWNVPSEYVGQMLSAYGTSVTQMPLASDKQALYGNSTANVEETMLSKHPFMLALQNIQSIGMGSFSDCFTWADLRRMDPTVESRAVVVEAGGLQPMGPTAYGYSTDSTGEWGAKTEMNVAATLLANSIPAFLIRYGLGVFAFRSTNREGGGPQILVTAASPLVPIPDLAERVVALRARVLNELIMNICMSGNLSYEVELECQLFNTTRIHLSLGSEPFKDYQSPTFCDALTSPLVTNDNHNVHNVASAFDNLITATVDTSSNTDFAKVFGSVTHPMDQMNNHSVSAPFGMASNL